MGDALRGNPQDERKQAMGENHSRRDVLSYLLGTGVAAGFGIGGYFGFKFVVPPKGQNRPVDVLIRKQSDLPDGAAYEFTDFRGQLVTLLNRQGTIRAFSSVCPHLGCKVVWEADKNRFFCPCHVGVFDPEGQVVSGPPPRPMKEFPVNLKDGYIYVSLEEA